ncbi:MAG: hypothetical protein II574_08010 [Ruminococcus sp.]|nr:hypothetical protein [Ruminococcus sp.]
MNKKTEKLSQIIMVSVFLIFIIGFGIWCFLLRDRTFSEMENRNLNQFPTFSWKNLKDGTFTDGLEKFVSDHIPFKDELVTLKTDTDRLLQHDLQNGVYFGKDGYYLQDYHEDTEQLEKNIGCINDLRKNAPDADISFMLVPNSISVMSDKLPSTNTSEDQQKTIGKVKEQLDSSINFYCPMSDLKAAADNGTQVFYKTDHHWTSDGAKVGFDGLMKAMDEPELKADYDVQELPDFLGTLYSKAPSAFTDKDTMKLLTDKSNKLTVNFVDKNETKDTIFDRSFEDKKDKYSIFFGGNYANINIKSENAQQDKKVLILKDSYANCAMPYFTSMYSDVTMIDMRYYHVQPLTVSEYIKENKIDKVILLYNVDFLNTDNNFVWID